ncbi:hypothetical protein JB92DRAFT_3096738 [Gautieria morchelliformis]|nr:hypothetical protein JB92DRAFT_3096738 [Gautieria morchelliformis]
MFYFVVLIKRAVLLWQEEIEHTYVPEVEFASEDEAERTRVKALNSLGGLSWVTRRVWEKVMFDDEDKKTILAALKGTTHWIDANVQSATADELEEKLSSVLLSLRPTVVLIAEVQAIVTPTTSNLYADGAGPQSHGPGEEDEKLTEDDHTTNYRGYYDLGLRCNKGLGTMGGCTYQPLPRIIVPAPLLHSMPNPNPATDLGRKTRSFRETISR